MIKGNINTPNYISGSVGNSTKLEHNSLINRDAPSAHQIEAIEGLTELIEKLKQDIKNITNQFYSLDTSAAKVEQERAMAAEQELDLDIKRINTILTTVNSDIDARYYEVSKAIIDEALARTRVDTSVTNDINTIKETINEILVKVASETDNTVNLVNEVKKSTENASNILSNHLEDFDKQVIKINNLINTFNNHIADFKAFVRSSKTADTEITNNISDITIQLNEKISEQILEERVLARQELDNLSKLLEVKLENISNELDTTINRVANNNISYLDSKIETMDLALETLDAKLATDIAHLNNSLASNIRIFESALNNLSTTLQTFSTDYYATNEAANARISEVYKLTSDLAVLLNTQVARLDTNINSTQTEAGIFYSTFCEYKNEMTQTIENVISSFDEKLVELDQKLNTEITNISERLTQESRAREAAINNLENTYKSYDAETLNAAETYTNDYANRLIADYTERDETLANEFAKADEVLYLKTQKLIADELKEYIQRLNELEVWQSNISNVLDFVGVTTTDITDSHNKNNSIVKIGKSFHDANKGDVVLYNNKEYVWSGGDSALGWEEIGIGSANEAAIAALQQLIGSNSIIPTGIFKLIADLRLYTDERFSTELEKTQKALDNLETDLNIKIDNNIDNIFKAIEKEKTSLIENLESIISNFQKDLEEINILKQKDEEMEVRLSLVETDFSQVKIEVNRLENSISNYWRQPETLLFNSRAEAETYLLENREYAFPGQLVSLSIDGLIETYVIVYITESAVELQMLSGGGGGGGGTPDRSTDIQYCIQTFGDFIPSALNHFIQEQENNCVPIRIPNEKRKNNSIITLDFTTNQLSPNGGYVYYLSKLDGLKFTSGGFDAGFSKISLQIDGLSTDYFIYRTNQKLIDPVTITIN